MKELCIHSKNVLIHQNSIKLADFGLSKRIDEASDSTLRGIIPYIDPRKYKRRNSLGVNSTQIHKLNVNSDVYSIGVLLWEISSERPPFYTEGETYDFALAMEILQGLREMIIPGTPEEYVKIYTECWDDELDNRPTMKQIVDRLISLISGTNSSINADDQVINRDQYTPISSNQQLNPCTSDPLQGGLSKVIQNFHGMDTAEVVKTITTSDKSLNRIIEEILILISVRLDKGKEWKKEIESDPNAMFLLGYFYYYGVETNIEKKMAFELFFNASKQQHTLSQYYVGLCYLFGDGVIKDEKLAFKYIETIANNDCVAGQLELGHFYKKAIGVEKDIRMAYKWNLKAAHNGNLRAKCILGNFYLNGEGVKKNYESAFELFRQSAEGGYSSGISMLGHCYIKGVGTNVNKQKAFALYQKAANLGNKTAQFNLAIIYKNGDGIDKDIDKAIHWYIESAKQEHRKAQYNLAIIYENGDGIHKDIDRAIYWYKKSAEQGHQKAQYSLARMFRIEGDIDGAIHWYRKSAGQGYYKAQYNLAQIYESGDDIDRAIYWYKKSAEQGDRNAQYNLAVIYENGVRIKDLDKATYWSERVI
ncbi:17632_t:CDS:2 [Funneliformis geosporum]|nr:17632_t:CDS:2 [Funneliformis geosporum]